MKKRSSRQAAPLLINRALLAEFRKLPLLIHAQENTLTAPGKIAPPGCDKILCIVFKFSLSVTA